MTNTPETNHAKSETAAVSQPDVSSAKEEMSSDSKKLVLKDIRAKWGKFSEQDLSAIKDKDDLVKQVVAKYGIDKAQAQKDVDGLLKDRQI